MKEFAALMNDRDMLIRYTDLESRLTGLLLDRFWFDNDNSVENKQTVYSILLCFDLLSDEDSRKATDSLLISLKQEDGLTTGIFGTKYLLAALTENGKGDAALEIVDNSSWPGWGYMIEQGATTIWETWKESDNTYSNCHPMFGSVSEWFYKYLAGISPDPENPGFKKIILKPAFLKGLDTVKCNYKSVYGSVISNWERIAGNSYNYYISVPDGSEAELILPEGVNNIDWLDLPTRNKGIEKNEGSYYLKAGEYKIRFSNKIN